MRSTGLVLAVTLAAACGDEPRAARTGPPADDPPRWLSAYHLFRGTGAALAPAPDVVEYEVNAPLFSDYTTKRRFVRVPPGSSIGYQQDRVFEFPPGTLLVKSFAEPGESGRVLETRVIERTAAGWRGLAYVWNEEGTDAELALAGAEIPVSFALPDSRVHSFDYMVPDRAACKGCHSVSGEFSPIGTRARQLDSGGQLEDWERRGLLVDLPAAGREPPLARPGDPASGATIDQRARAWLEANCAHCHDPAGPARASGLFLSSRQSDPYRLGVGKPPVAAGRGSGGRTFGIVPGSPDLSILVHRIESTELDIRMPEAGLRLVHREGVALVRQWIAEMKEQE